MSPTLRGRARITGTGQVRQKKGDLSNDSSPPGGTATTTRYYYDGQNVIAEYMWNGSTEVPARQYVNGTWYIALDTPRGFAALERKRVRGESRGDERVVMRDVAGGNKDHYYLHEELYSVAGMASMNGTLEEMYVYDTYGRATVWAWPIGDLNRSGTVNSFDWSKVRYWVETINSPLGDVNEDGNLNSFDLAEVVAHYGDIPVALTYSALDNPFMFTGRLTDTINDSDVPFADDDTTGFRRIQDNRNRTYDPHHGRWFQRDPLGVRPDAPRGTIEVLKQLADGPNLYNYVMSCPTQFSDAEGTRTYLPERWYIGLRCVVYCGCRGIEASAQSATTAGYNAANELIKGNDSAHRAIRHCVASGLLATKVGCSCAWCIGEKAEDFQDENGQDKRNSDRARFNNRQGRICAGCIINGDRDPWSRTECFTDDRGNTLCVPIPVPPTASLDQIIKCCTDKLKNGELDSGSGPSPPDTPD